MGELRRDASTLGGVAGAHKTEGNKEFFFCYVATGVSAGQPRVMTFSSTTTAQPVASAPATITAYQQYVVFPMIAGAADYQWCQFKGDASVLVNGTTDVAAGDFLKLINGGTSLIKDAATRSADSCAISQVAYTTDSAALTAVYILGERSNIPAA